MNDFEVHGVAQCHLEGDMKRLPCHLRWAEEMMKQAQGREPYKASESDHKDSKRPWWPWRRPLVLCKKDACHCFQLPCLSLSWSVNSDLCVECCLCCSLYFFLPLHYDILKLKLPGGFREQGSSIRPRRNRKRDQEVVIFNDSNEGSLWKMIWLQSEETCSLTKDPEEKRGWNNAKTHWRGALELVGGISLPNFSRL